MSTAPASTPVETKPIQIDIPPAPEGATAAEIALRQKVIDEVVSSVFSQVQSSLEVDYALRLATTIESLEVKYGDLLAKEMEKFKKSLTPPTTEEVRTLLTQEYITFQVTVRAKAGERQFTIVEVPQETELQFTRKLEAAIVPKLQEMQNLQMVMTDDTSVEDKIKHVVDLLGRSLDAMAEITVVVLNPFGDEQDIDVTWVKSNLSSYRMLQIIQAQVHCNRIRDFFLQLFQLTSR